MKAHSFNQHMLYIGTVILFGLVLIGLPSTSEAATKSASEKLFLRASTTVDISCMGAAVATRETALGNARSKLSSSTGAALADRRTALVAAWNISDTATRARAISAAWKEWKAGKKAAHNDFRKERRAAWETFKKTAKDSCKVRTPKEESLESAEKDSVAI